MKGKIRYFSIAITAILVLSIFPNIQSISTPLSINNSMKSSVDTKDLDSEMMMFKIYHIKEDGSSQLSKKSISAADMEILKEELKIIDLKDTSIYETFYEKFNVLKRYDLIPENTILEDVINPKLLPEKTEVVSGEDFNATTAPIFFFGGGLGVGLGVPFFVTAGTFLVALLGFGLTLCYDLREDILYQLITLTLFPILIGYLSGFVGLLMIPVVPGFVYSNFLAIGAVAKTTWIQLIPI